MIPRKIHYCWFGPAPIPPEAHKCIDSWHRHMPDWDYYFWNEDNFDVDSFRYTREAYNAGKFAFVSDVARLVALNTKGGLYLDTDVEVFRSFEPLLHHQAFAGFEGSKHSPVMTAVLASQPNGLWVQEMLLAYHDRPFILDGQPDTTTNVTFLSAIMRQNGLIQNGQEQDYKDLHIFPVDFFSPRLTTGEYIRTDNTFCDHREFNSWGSRPHGWKHLLRRIVGQRFMTFLIKTKRRFSQ